MLLLTLGFRGLFRFQDLLNLFGDRLDLASFTLVLLGVTSGHLRIHTLLGELFSFAMFRIVEQLLRFGWRGDLRVRRSKKTFLRLGPLRSISAGLWRCLDLLFADIGINLERWSRSINA